MISVIWSFTPGPTDLTRLLRDPWSLELFEILMTQKFPSKMVDTSPWLPWSPCLPLVNLVTPVRLVTLISLVILDLGQPSLIDLVKTVT